MNFQLDNEEIALGITYRGHINNHQWVYYHFTSTEVSDLSVIMTQVQGSSIQLVLISLFLSF